MPFSRTAINEEQAHFSNVIQTFRQYAAYSLSANNRRRKDFFTLPRADQELLHSLRYKEKLAEVDRAILANAEFLNQIVVDPEIFGHELEGIDDPGVNDVPGDTQGPFHSHSHDHTHGPHSHSHDAPTRASQGHAGPEKKGRYRPTDFDMDKLRSTLKQFVRDWSEEGRAEREVCYAPMREALLQHFSDIPPAERHNLRVLVPGAGLGRLAWDIANLGFACQGNEFSHYMLLASFFILNRTDSVNQHTIYPYVHSFSNLPNNAAMLRPITIPDITPSSLPQGSNFSLVAGDFEEIYGADDDADEPHSGQWDAVLTCFFIDTAKNIVNYLRVIHRILAPGGVWINLGPLLWHFENNTTNDPSIELTLEEVKALARKIGFDISNERTIDTTYTNNAQSMLGYVYHAAFWTAKKII
ncbi:N2227-domain-containing protein [Rhodofomes roseus]|uniref:carnosine N-methyltransferase n=1 Tax=Rhodofomes roseus TaxID=34475 RepID=A0ABQ8JYP8_9APHY|nr:N2227-domain-containing protein [Rhodofomes roseus]KAH9829226.1 N2227-domain-containing protein [Rhodofomes roseus]